MTTTQPPITFLGLGAMGHALADAALDAGHPITVWNRSAVKADAIASRGATVAATVGDAVTAAPVVIACLFDHASVHETLDPIVDALRGRALVNLTTTSPAEARELAAWATANGIDYLDGGIMATPPMIGRPGSSIFFSGDAAVFRDHEQLLALWGEPSYFGDDAGMASLYDLAMLSGMYIMFAGFLHGAAMVSAAGISAADFAARQTTFLAAMTGAFTEMARVVDAGDYAGPGQQSLEFSDLTKLVEATEEVGVNTDVIGSVHRLIRRQIDAGHGKLGFDRIFEELRGAA